MFKHPLFDLVAGRTVINGAQQFRRHVDNTVQRALARATGSQGTGDDAPLSAVYEDHLLFRGPIAEAMSLFDTFALYNLSDWRKTAAGARGSAVFAQYHAARTFNVKLRPRTLRAQMSENGQRRNPRYDRCIEPVSYEYLMDLEFANDPAGTRAWYRTRETIDPGARATRDLARHYAAPNLPAGFGAIGPAFFASLRATGRA